MANVTYQHVIRLAEHELKSTGHTSQEKTMSSRDLVDAIQKAIKVEKLELSLARASFFNYISHAANKDENSSIASGGAWGGYWYDSSEIVETSNKPVEEAKIESGQGKQFSFSERDLYPLLHLWLGTKDFVAKDISNLKSGGKWGNPDVIGVRRVDLFGSTEIEIASCEVKLSEANWEQFIFEAISHKRFSNRSWFAYRISQAGKTLPKGIEYYAERYKVGIIQILLKDEELARLKTQKTDVLEDLLDRVNERVPAFYEHVPLQEKAELFERAKIAPTFTFE